MEDVEDLAELDVRSNYRESIYENGFPAGAYAFITS